MDNRKKIEFLKYVLIGRVHNIEYLENWRNNNQYPTDEEIDSIISQDMDPARLEGLDWPTDAMTMIGLKRMNNLHEMLDYVRENNIDGDFIETGVWKGGATIFMKLYSDIYKMGKKVFVCDSFKGLPEPSDKYPQDRGDIHHTYTELAISIEEVMSNFESMKCLDDDVVFVEGFFSETLPNNDKIQKLSILRMDGDMYESTHDVFYSCYDKLVDKGVCIIDDYCLNGARNCVHDFRKEKNINDPMNKIDVCGIYWIKNLES